MNWLSGIYNWVLSLFRIPQVDTEEVAKIQEAAVKLCGFLPTAETVSALMGVNPVFSIIPKKICQAVTSVKSVTRLVGTETLKPEVDGVVIEGDWIK